MKNTRKRQFVKRVAAIALAVIIGFSMAACGDSDSGSGNGNGGGGGGGSNSNDSITYSVTADGSSTQTTTQLTLTFSKAISGLTAADITLNLSGQINISKGTLSGSNPYTLPITLPISNSTYSGPYLYVTVVKSGYNIQNSLQPVNIFYIKAPVIIEMLSIPAGTFTMGSPTSEVNRKSDETQHSVTLSAFSMSKHQVTQAQYQEVMGAGEDRTETIRGKGNNYPIYNVNWYDAIVFCNKLSIKEELNPVYSINGSTNPDDWGTTNNNNATWDAAVMDKSKNGYRLPTEAEWEYACRAGTTSYYNIDTLYNAAWYGGEPKDPKTHEVGKKSPNAWGLYDMHGNVWEWCWDWYGSYLSGSQTNPTGAVSGGARVNRGGCWSSDIGYGELRSAYRNCNVPYNRDIYTGFRLVRSN